MIRGLVRKESERWNCSGSKTALELIRLLLHWIEQNELTRKEVDHSAINEMYVDWYSLKAELVREEKLSAKDGR